MDRIINFPEINWEKIREGAISKEMVWESLEKGVKALLEVQMLKKTGFLVKKETLDKANDILRQMEDLQKEYPQVIGMIQNIFGRQVKEMAVKNGDSRTLFSRLQFLVSEAVFHGCLKEWNEKDLERVPAGLKKNFGVQLYDPRTRESRYFLPYNWRNETHKRTALILHDLSFKARDTYKAEKGISTPQKPAETKPEIPLDTKIETLVATPEPKQKKTAPKTRTTRKPKAPRKDEADVRAAKRTKAEKLVDEEKEAEKEIQDAKKVGSFAEIGSLLKK